MTDGNVCDVCERNEPMGVAAVPGQAISVAYCRACLAENNATYPLWLADNVANDICGGLENTADWFRESITFKDGEYMTIEKALTPTP